MQKKIKKGIIKIQIEFEGKLAYNFDDYMKYVKEQVKIGNLQFLQDAWIKKVKLIK